MKKFILLLIQKNIFFIFLLSILLIPISINAQGWEKIYGFESIDRSKSIIQTLDGGYLTLNYTFQDSIGDFMMNLRKLDTNGEEEWFKFFEGEYSFGTGEIMETPNGNVVVVSTKQDSVISNQRNINILKLNNDGIEIWHKDIIKPVSTVGNSILFTNDGNYMISGQSWELIDNEYKNRFLLLKLNPEGEVIWENLYGSDNNNNIGQLELYQTQDNGYIITGLVYNNIYGYDAFWVKTDSEGNENWKNTYDYTSFDYAQNIHQLDDGSYRLFCLFRINEPNTQDYTKFGMLKLNGNGEVQQNITIDSIFSNPGKNLKGRRTDDGNFIVFSSTAPPNSALGDNYHLYKVDTDGNVLWEKEHGQNYHTSARNIQTTSDGGFIMTGHINSTNSTNDEVYIVKTNDLGEITNTFELGQKESVNIYPNPTNGIVLINLELPQVSEVQVRIYDITGKEVLTSPKQSIYENQLEFNLSSFSDGVYIVKITVDDAIIAKRIVVQKF
ncbi:MAG: hypothetical protein ACI8RP_001542 [Urechidicola sp.]|jgi:hypothetical protein